MSNGSPQCEPCEPCLNCSNPSNVTVAEKYSLSPDTLAENARWKNALHNDDEGRNGTAYVHVLMCPLAQTSVTEYEHDAAVECTGGMSLFALPTQQSCNSAYLASSPLCSTCAHGYGRHSNRICEKCSNFERVRGSITGLTVVFVLGCWTLYLLQWYTLQRALRWASSACRRKKTGGGELAESWLADELQTAATLSTTSATNIKSVASSPGQSTAASWLQSLDDPPMKRQSSAPHEVASVESVASVEASRDGGVSVSVGVGEGGGGAGGGVRGAFARAWVLMCFMRRAFVVLVNPLKIIISYSQIVSQLPPVMNVAFPPMVMEMLHVMGMMVFDVRKLVSLDCVNSDLSPGAKEGGTGLSFSQKWWFRVVIVPGLSLYVVLLWCLHQSGPGFGRRREAVLRDQPSMAPDQVAAKARRLLHADSLAFVFMVLFLLYPQVCHHIFSVFHYRTLSTSPDDGTAFNKVLVEDYSQDYIMLQSTRLWVFAIMAVVVFAFGVPVYTAVVLWYAQRQADEDSSKNSRTDLETLNRPFATRVGHFAQTVVGAVLSPLVELRALCSREGLRKRAQSARAKELSDPLLDDLLREADAGLNDSVTTGTGDVGNPLAGGVPFPGAGAYTSELGEDLMSAESSVSLRSRLRIDTHQLKSFQTKLRAFKLRSAAGSATKLSANNEKSKFVARRVAEDLDISDKAAAMVVRDVLMKRDFNFLVAAFQPQYYWWEALDMLRKLMLVGMLVLLSEERIEQAYVASLVSLVFLSLQVALNPYRHNEDNLLKTCTEVQLMLFMLNIVITQARGQQDPSTKSSAAMFLVSFETNMIMLSFVLLVPLPFVYTMLVKAWKLYVASPVLRRRAKQRVENDATDKDSLQKRREAFGLYNLGMHDGESLEVLQRYFYHVEEMVGAWIDSDYHIFISYRQRTEGAVKEEGGSGLAKTLYDSLVARKVGGEKMRVFLDVVCMPEGQNYEPVLLNGLGKSSVIMPLVSMGAIIPMAKLSQDIAAHGHTKDRPDWVLNEWIIALELRRRGAVVAIPPIICGKRLQDGSRTDFFADGSFDAIADVRSEVTIDASRQFLMKMTGDNKIGLEDLSIKGIVNQILSPQAVLLHRITSEIQHTESITIQRQRESVKAAKSEYLAKLRSEWKQAAAAAKARLDIGTVARVVSDGHELDGLEVTVLERGLGGLLKVSTPGTEGLDEEHSLAPEQLQPVSHGGPSYTPPADGELDVRLRPECIMPEDFYQPLIAEKTAEHILKVILMESTVRGSTRHVTSAFSNVDKAKNADDAEVLIAAKALKFSEKSVLGKGGFGHVYAALYNEADVSVKIMAELRSQDPKYINKFKDEMRQLAALRHPYVVQFLGMSYGKVPVLGHKQQVWMMVMELCGGGDLYDYLRRPEARATADDFDFDEVDPECRPHQLSLRKRQIAFDVARGLLFLHKQELLHLDVKSPNIMLSRHYDTAKIADFGMARNAKKKYESKAEKKSLEESYATEFKMSNLGQGTSVASTTTNSSASARPIPGLSSDSFQFPSTIIVQVLVRACLAYLGHSKCVLQSRSLALRAQRVSGARF